MKILEHPNPFVAGGVSKSIVLRETKTQYICKNNTRYHKPEQEYDGCSVRAIGADRWDASYTLHIIKDKPALL